MTDNRTEYGFRPWKATGGRDNPVPLEVFVASAVAFNVNNGAQGVGIGVGDLVVRANTGGVVLCDGTEGAASTVAPQFVVVGVAPYWNATTGRMEYGATLPSGTTYGTVLERQSKLYVVPVDQFLWEVDVDDIVTATTLAAYQAFVGENVDHINAGASGETRAKPKLDISTHGTGNTLMWRIVEVSPSRNNQDFAGANVKLIVEANVAQRPGRNLTGI